MFIFFRQRAYCQLLAAFALGIASGARWPLPAELFRGAAVPLALILAALALLWLLWHKHPSAFVLAPGFAAIVVIGYLSVSATIGSALTAPLRRFADGESHVMTGRITSIPKYARGHLRFLMQVESLGRKNRFPAPGLCYVYLKCDESQLVGEVDAASRLYYSDVLCLRASLDEVPAPLNRGQFNYRGYLLQRGTVLTAYAYDAQSVERLTPGRPAIWAGLDELRRRMTSALAAGLPAELGPLAVSVVFGDKITDLPPEMEERFRRAGLTHILVASGTQVSLLILVLAGLFGRFSNDFSWRGALLNAGQFTLTMSAVLAYSAITGFETSIARAFVMGALVMVGKLLNREADGLTTLAQSGLILLILNPLQLLAPGFQLSFGATFGLIYAAGIGFPLVAEWGRWQRVAQALITTGGAQLFVAPLLAAEFHQLSLWGMASNMLAIPLAFGLLIVGGLQSLGLGAVPLLGIAVRYLVWGLCLALDGVARLFAALPGSNIAVPTPPWWWLLALYALLFIVGEWAKTRSKLSPGQLLALSAALAGTALLVLAGALSWLCVPRPELACLALDGGEAYLWRPYSGQSVLLLRSAGLSSRHNAETVASALRVRGINRLHGIVWLDEPPQERLLPDTPAPEFALGADLPATWDVAWLSGGGSVCGAKFGLGGNESLIIFEPQIVSGAGIKQILSDDQPLIVAVSGLDWLALDDEQRAALGGCGQLVLLQPDSTDQGESGTVAAASEVNVLPGSHGDTLWLKQYNMYVP